MTARAVSEAASGAIVASSGWPPGPSTVRPPGVPTVATSRDGTDTTTLTRPAERSVETTRTSLGGFAPTAGAPTHTEAAAARATANRVRACLDVDRIVEASQRQAARRSSGRPFFSVQLPPSLLPPLRGEGAAWIDEEGDMGRIWAMFGAAGAVAASVVVATAGPASAQTPMGTVTVVHGLRGVVADVYVDGQLALPTFQPDRVTDPIQVPAGSHHVEIRQAGDPATAPPAVTADVDVIAGGRQSIVAHLSSTGAPTVTVYQ